MKPCMCIHIYIYQYIKGVYIYIYRVCVHIMCIYKYIQIHIFCHFICQSFWAFYLGIYLCGIYFDILSDVGPLCFTAWKPRPYLALHFQRIGLNLAEFSTYDPQPACVVPIANPTNMNYHSWCIHVYTYIYMYI